MKNEFLIKLDSTTTPDLANKCGGKFAGLHKIASLIEKWQKEYDFDMQIPKTYAIPTDVYDKYNLSDGIIPEELINEAMQALAACGGCAAVRSSADVEDKAGKTHSGEFASVLSVRNKQQMREALKTVYASAHNVPDAKMGVIIQPMIEAPKMAGVAYSETWYGDPFVVINYVENQFADKLMVNDGDDGVLFAIAKACVSQDSDVALFNLEKLSSNTYDVYHWEDKNHKSPQKTNIEYFEKNKNLFYIGALINSLEESLGYPIDMEFAVSKNGKINILQQRPYCLPVFYENKIDANTTAVFSPQKPIIYGEVCFAKIANPFNKAKYSDIVVCKDDKFAEIYTRESFGVRDAFLGLREKTPFAAQYNHFGNMERDSLDFTMLETYDRSANFEHIKAGDYMKLDLLTGEFKTYPKKDKTFNIANVVQMLKQQKSK